MNSSKLRSSKGVALVGAMSVATFCSPAFSQSFGYGTARGMGGGFPLGAIVEDVNSSLGGVRIKRQGDLGGLPVEFDPAIHPVGTAQPDYSTVDKLDAGGSMHTLKIDAHSTGNARMPRFGGISRKDSTTPLDLGVPNLGTAEWFAISTALANNDGVKQTSFFATFQNEVVAYYFSDNEGLGPSFQGNALVDLKRKQVGFNGFADRYFGAMDYGMGFLVFDDLNLPQGFFGNSYDYYFSVTPAFCADFNCKVDNGFAREKGGTASTPATLEARPGDIYIRRWTGSTALGFEWDIPEVYCAAKELGLHEGGDVDALDVNPSEAAQVLVYSVSSASDFNDVDSPGTPVIPLLDRSQLMVHQEAKPGHSAPDGIVGMAVKDRSPNGAAPIKVVDKIGIGDVTDRTPADITGTCLIDPENSVRITAFGIPRPDPSPLCPSDPQPMGMSVTRTRTPLPSGQGLTPDAQVQVLISGWGVQGKFKGTTTLCRQKVVGGGTGAWEVVAMKARAKNQESITISLDTSLFVVGETYHLRAIHQNAAGTKSACSIMMKLDS